MADLSNVLNRNQQPKPGSKDNPLIIGGSFVTGADTSLKTQRINILVSDIIAATNQHLVFSAAGIITSAHAVLEVAQGGGDDFVVTMSKFGAGNLSNGIITFGNNSPVSDVKFNVIDEDANSNFGFGGVLVFSRSGSIAANSTMNITLEYNLL